MSGQWLQPRVFRPLYTGKGYASSVTIGTRNEREREWNSEWESESESDRESVLLIIKHIQKSSLRIVGGGGVVLYVSV